MSIILNVPAPIELFLYKNPECTYTRQIPALIPWRGYRSSRDTWVCVRWWDRKWPPVPLVTCLIAALPVCINVLITHPRLRMSGHLWRHNDVISNGGCHDKWGAGHLGLDNLYYIRNTHNSNISLDLHFLCFLYFNCIHQAPALRPPSICDYTTNESLPFKRYNHFKSSQSVPIWRLPEWI